MKIGKEPIVPRRANLHTPESLWGVPFLVEDELKKKGGIYTKGPDWQSYVVCAGTLVTGQNPASSGATAHKLLELLAGGKA